MEEDGFISNITIGNVISKPRKSTLDKKKDKKQKYLERKMIKKQNRKKYEEIIERKREARERMNNSENNNNNRYRKDAYHPIRKNYINNNSNKDDNDNIIDKEKEEEYKVNEFKLKNTNKDEINKNHLEDIKLKDQVQKTDKKDKNNVKNELMKDEINDKNKKNKTEENNKSEEVNNNEEYDEKEEENVEKETKEENIIKKNFSNKKNVKEEKIEIKNDYNNNETQMEIEEEKPKIKNIKNNIINNNNKNNKTKSSENNNSFQKKSNSSQTIFSIKSFEDLKINPYLKKAINKNNYNIMTKIQKKAIPILLEHKNVIVKSETGSGKTLAYIIPLYQNLIEINEFEKINRKNGVYSIIFSPTHELCLQIEKTFDKLKSCCINVVYGSLMGGQKIETEKKKLRKGLNVIITTPGRLLYHLQNTENINFTTLKMIIIDEADLMLDMGFEKDIKECFKLIIQKSENNYLNSEEEIVLNPDLFKKFKIFLISATIDNRIRKMSNYFMKGFKAIGFEKEDEKDKEINEQNNIDKENNINNQDEKTHINNVSSNYYLSALKQQNITQYYSYINDEYRLIHLLAFLYNNLFQKAIIFVSTCDLCEYLSKIITDIEIDINYKSDFAPIQKEGKKSKSKISQNESKLIHLFTQKTYKLHGKMKHDERKIVFNEFNEDSTGILIATDVAARGLDFKDINWVIHYDINPDIKEYINRIGRTARIDNIGNSILFLMQNERKLLDTCFKSIKNNLYEMKNSDILISFIQNINKNILKNKIDIDNNKNKKDNDNENDDIVDENEIYKRKYLFAINPILKCIKNFIFKDKNNLILARKAFKSEIRSYVTFLKYAKDVFNVKALNLTRMSRSFGLYKESLSMKVGTDQVNIDYQIDKKEKFTQRKFLNKKIQNKLIYSEFE